MSLERAKGCLGRTAQFITVIIRTSAPPTSPIDWGTRALPGLPSVLNLIWFRLSGRRRGG
jgi:hypothetical protein